MEEKKKKRDNWIDRQIESEENGMRDRRRMVDRTRSAQQIRYPHLFGGLAHPVVQASPSQPKYVYVVKASSLEDSEEGKRWEEQKTEQLRKSRQTDFEKLVNWVKSKLPKIKINW